MPERLKFVARLLEDLTSAIGVELALAELSTADVYQSLRPAGCAWLTPCPPAGEDRKEERNGSM